MDNQNKLLRDSNDQSSDFEYQKQRTEDVYQPFNLRKIDFEKKNFDYRPISAENQKLKKILIMKIPKQARTKSAMSTKKNNNQIFLNYQLSKNKIFGKRKINQAENTFKQQQTFEKEKLQDDAIQLKKQINQIKEENLQLRSQLNKKDRQLVRLEEMIEQMNLRYNPSNIEKIKLIQMEKSFKQTVKSLQQEIKYKTEELEKIKKNAKTTRVNELEVEIKLYIDECTRLKHLLEEAFQGRLGVLPGQVEFLELQELRLNMQIMTQQNKSLRQENKQLYEKNQKLEEQSQQFKQKIQESEANYNKQKSKLQKIKQQEIKSLRDQVKLLQLDLEEKMTMQDQYNNQIKEAKKKQEEAKLQLQKLQQGRAVTSDPPLRFKELQEKIKKQEILIQDLKKSNNYYKVQFQRTSSPKNKIQKYGTNNQHQEKLQEFNQNDQQQYNQTNDQSKKRLFIEEANTKENNINQVVQKNQNDEGKIISQINIIQQQIEYPNTFLTQNGEETVNQKGIEIQNQIQSQEIINDKAIKTQEKKNQDEKILQKSQLISHDNDDQIPNSDKNLQQQNKKSIQFSPEAEINSQIFQLLRNFMQSKQLNLSQF